MHIRQLFKLIDEQRNRIAIMEVQAARLKEERDAARIELDATREVLWEERLERS